MIAAEKEKVEAAREFEASENQLDRENDIEVAAIKVMSFDSDTMDNGVIDSVEEGKAAIERSKVASDTMNKQLDRNSAIVEGDKNRQLKREELRSKENIEKLKAKTALKNKVSGEK